MNTILKLSMVTAMLAFASLGHAEKLEGKIQDAKYDKDTGKIIVKVKSKKWCQETTPRLEKKFAQVRPLGRSRDTDSKVLNFDFKFGITTAKKCIPAVELEKEYELECPADLDGKKSTVKIYGESGTMVSVEVDKRDALASEGHNPDLYRHNNASGAAALQ